MSASRIDGLKLLEKIMRFEPSKSRMLKAMNASTKGMHTMHTVRVDLNNGSFIATDRTFALLLLLVPSLLLVDCNT